MTERPYVFETHHIVVHAPAPEDAPEYRSRSGSGPMRPRGVRIHYDLTGTYPPHAEVVGDRLSRSPFERPRADYLRRRVPAEDVATAPEWLQAMIAAHNPGVCCERVSPR